MAFTRRLIIVGAVLAATPSFALAETMPGQNGMGSPQMMMQQHHQQGVMSMASHRSMSASTVTPTMPGQDAFGAIQEIARILAADPKTDWSKVNLEALRQHLIDMNEVTLKADAAAKPIDGGLEIAVTGTGRTVEAIQRMVAAHGTRSTRRILMVGAPKPPHWPMA